VSLQGAGSQFQRALERFECVIIVFLSGVDDSQQVVGIDAGRIQLDLLVDDLPGLFELALLNQFLGFLKWRRDCGRLAGVVFLRELCSRLPQARNRQRRKKAESGAVPESLGKN